MKTAQAVYRQAKESDLETITLLLQDSGLPAEDIAGILSDFIVAVINEGLVGVIGMEIKGSSALLRSLAVSPLFRNRGIADQLYRRILAYAEKKGVRDLYLLTTTAELFFQRKGFVREHRDGIPEEIRSTAEFTQLCPETAVCMSKRIDMNSA